MEKNQSLLIASVVFGVVALLHLLRSIFEYSLVIENFDVPLYFSYIAVIFLGYLSWNMYSASKK